MFNNRELDLLINKIDQIIKHEKNNMRKREYIDILIKLRKEKERKSNQPHLRLLQL